jgi:hypothetical protein
MKRLLGRYRRTTFWERQTPSLTYLGNVAERKEDNRPTRKGESCAVLRRYFAIDSRMLGVSYTPTFEGPAFPAGPFFLGALYHSMLRVNAAPQDSGLHPIGAPARARGRALLASTFRR